MPITPEEFMARAERHARMYNPFAVTIQCMKETGTKAGPFTSKLCIEANNFGGIKCKRFWLMEGRECTFVVSDEEIAGKKEPVRSSFRVYRDLDDYLECLNDKLLEPGTNYSVAVKHRNCFWLHFAGMYFGGWATDTKYFDDLCYRAVRFAPRLLKGDWHKHLRESFAYALSRGVMQEWMKRTIKEALVKGGIKE